MTASLLPTRLSVGILCGLIFGLELVAPTEYVFGHLYIAPLLIAGFRLSSKDISIVTIVAIILTLSDLLIPNIASFRGLDLGDLPVYIIINRANVVVVLLLTNLLLHRHLMFAKKIARQQQEIAEHKTELLAQFRIAQMREDFVHTLTHDLKTPLLGAIQTIRSFQQQQFGIVSEIQSKVLNTMSRSQQRSLQLVETLLDVYRNDAEGLALQLQPIDLWSIAKEAVDAVVILGLERQIKLNLKSYESATHQPPIAGDRLQLSRVFSNLLSNAIYHSPRGGQIDITIHYRERQYIIRVADRGKGIAAEDLPLLFDRFYQAQAQAQGSGLGLYLSRQIVEAHGGKIWAEAVLPQGTQFCFSLPAGA
jgi:two-component system, NarL family, sensor kinase